MGKLTLILGGARSGKSSYAERLAAKSGLEVAYIATAQALDDEMAARIAAHRRSRPAAWQTLEISIGVGKALLTNPPQAGVVLLDCLTLLVSNLCLAAAPDPDHPNEKEAEALVQVEIDALIRSVQASAAHWIIVSNEVGLGLTPPYPLGRVYRDLLGRANQRLAQAADKVVLMVAGIPLRLERDDQE